MKAPPRLIPLLELEAWFRPEGSTLKSLFDNLRNYPILALLFYVLSFIDARPGFLAALAYWVLTVFFTFIAIFTAFQTAMLMTGFFMWLLLGETRAKREKASETTATWAAAVESLLVLLFFVVVLASSVIAVSEFGRAFAHLKPAV